MIQKRAEKVQEKKAKRKAREDFLSSAQIAPPRLQSLNFCLEALDPPLRDIPAADREVIHATILTFRPRQGSRSCAVAAKDALCVRAEVRRR